jgi:hypothetical protein
VTGRLLRAWFAGAFEAMGGRLRDTLLAAGPLSAANLRGRPVNQPFGRPGEVWAIVQTTTRGARGLRNKTDAFSVQVWDRFLDALAGKAPLRAAFRVASRTRFPPSTWWPPPTRTLPLPDAPDDPPYYVSRRDAAELQG